MSDECSNMAALMEQLNHISERLSNLEQNQNGPSRVYNTQWPSLTEEERLVDHNNRRNETHQGWNRVVVGRRWQRAPELNNTTTTTYSRGGQYNRTYGNPDSRQSNDYSRQRNHHNHQQNHYRRYSDNRHHQQNHQRSDQYGSTFHQNKVCKHVQISLQLDNWSNIPKRLAKEIDTIFRNINLAMPDRQLKDTLQKASDDTKSLIVSIAQEHLTNRLNQLTEGIQNAEPEQLNAERRAAPRLLREHFGRRTSNNRIREKLNEIPEVGDHRSATDTVTEQETMTMAIQVPACDTRENTRNAEAMKETTTMKDGDQTTGLVTHISKEAVDSVTEPINVAENDLRRSVKRKNISPIHLNNNRFAPLFNLEEDDDDVEASDDEETGDNHKAISNGGRQKKTRKLTIGQETDIGNDEGTGTPGVSEDNDDVESQLNNGENDHEIPAPAPPTTEEQITTNNRPAEQNTEAEDNNTAPPNTEDSNNAQTNTDNMPQQPTIPAMTEHISVTPNQTRAVRNDNWQVTRTIPMHGGHNVREFLSQTIAVDDNSATRGNKYMYNRPIIYQSFGSGIKRDWAVESISSGTQILIIADSNLRHIRNQQPATEIHVFPGAKLNHVAQIINNLYLPPSVKYIITHVGINNRTWGWSGIQPDLNKVINALRKTERLFKFCGVSIPPELPEREKATLRMINGHARNRLAAEFLEPVPENQVGVDPTDRYNIHYDFTTLQKLNRIISSNFLARRSSLSRIF